MLPATRTFVYLGIFVAGSVLYELLSRLMNPAVWSNSSIVLALSALGVFILTGALFVCERHMLSRVTSAATLFVLGVIALKIGHTTVPDPYLFAIAFCVSFLGAQAVFHRRSASRKRVILYSLAIVCVALAVALVFAYGVTVIDRIVIQQ